MLEIVRLGICSDCIELVFPKRAATSEPAMKLIIRLHLAGLSLSNTISVLDMLGFDRCRSTAHNWVRKAELQSTDGAELGHVAVDETVIQLNDERFVCCGSWRHELTALRAALSDENTGAD